MKTSKKCLSCEGEEIYETDAQFFGDGVTAIPNAKGLWELGVGVETFVCGSCGHIAFYLKPDHLQKVKEKYRRV